MLKLRKTAPAEPLVVSMTGLRLGDRVLFLGASDRKSIVLLAARPGLSGRACVVDEDAARAESVAADALKDGTLLETAIAPVTALPHDEASFDVVVVSHLLSRLPEARRSACLQEAARVLRPGGRCVVVEPARPAGLASLFGGRNRMAGDEVVDLMAQSFRGVRTLAARAGLLFNEGAAGRG